MTSATAELRVLEDVRIPMRDGSWLAANLFMPAEDGPHPAVLEYLPYRKSAHLASQIRPHRHFAQNGYVSVQIDCRGTGASPGASYDEYTEQEQQDGYDACEWLASQPWCTGAVGAFGISYGGYTSCQLAANRAPHLKAIAPMHGFDDHYTDDCHYSGGQVRIYDVGRYGNRMLAMNALPPTSDPADEGWTELWRERLERSEPWYLQWLEHQTDGPYWWTGSIRERVEEIECAVLLWGGWCDGYTNPIFRMFPRLRGPKRAIVGPWMHMRPDTAIPGPRIDWLRETTRWWDQWLKGIDTGVKDEPPVVVYMQSFDRPASERRSTSGYWRAEDALPAPSARDDDLFLAGGGTLASSSGGPEGSVQLEYRAAVGLAGGEFSAGGLPDFGLPLDQRLDEGYSLVYTTPPLLEPLEILGHPRVVLHAASSAPVALFCIKLSDVEPGGVSALVAKGNLNATRRSSLTAPEPLEPGWIYDLEIELDATAWRFEPGHRLRLTISTADFPSLWPTPEAVIATIHHGGERPSRLVLPRVPVGDPAGSFAPFAEPPDPDDSGRGDVVDRYHRVELDALEDAVEVRMGFATRSDLPDGTVLRDSREMSARASNRDPAHTRASGHTRMSIVRAGTTYDVEASPMVASTADAFDVAQRLNVEVDGAPYFEREWKRVVPRQLI